MTTTNTDAAREAARFIVEQTFKNPTYDGDPSIADLAIDAFLSKALEGADEKIKTAGDRWHTASLNPERYAAWVDAHAHEDMHTLLTLVTALSAKLAAQKAAHAKMLRDEADKLGDWPPLVSRHIRRLADKIEGGE